MLSVEELLRYYPAPLQSYREFILREYLQYKILQIVFNIPRYATKLCFLGGTCLRIVHGNQRFSEDLDFDNFGLTEDNFQDVSEEIRKELQREGYQVEIKTIYKGAFHCHVRFPGLMFRQGLSGHKEQKILIQLDTEPQHFSFQPEKHIINRFDVFVEIPVTPIRLLLAQKFYAIMNRSRSKGRDFFDAVFLLSKNIKPDYDYLKQKLNIEDAITLREKLTETCSLLDMDAMAEEVAPFLFNSSDNIKVKKFQAYIQQVEL